jgi:hypothetical protein
MREERRMESGKAIGTKLAATYINSWTKTPNSIPFPTKSSMYFHKNCMSRTKMEMKNVAIKGDIKDFNINFEEVFNVYF